MKKYLLALITIAMLVGCANNPAGPSGTDIKSVEKFEVQIVMQVIMDNYHDFEYQPIEFDIKVNGAAVAGYDGPGYASGGKTCLLAASGNINGLVWKQNFITCSNNTYKIDAKNLNNKDILQITVLKSDGEIIALTIDIGHTGYIHMEGKF